MYGCLRFLYDCVDDVCMILYYLCMVCVRLCICVCMVCVSLVYELCVIVYMLVYDLCKMRV